MPPPWAAVADPQPTGVAFTLVLLCHVACVVVGLGAVVVSFVQAGRLSSAGPGEVSQGLRTYYAPGPNWAGRVLVGVPVFGVALLAMSHGDYRLSQGWVLGGLGLWCVAIGVAEGVLWPAERALAARVAEAGGDHAGAPGPGAAFPGPGARPYRAGCAAVRRAAAVTAVVLVAASVLMVVRP